MAVVKPLCLGLGAMLLLGCGGGSGADDDAGQEIDARMCDDSCVPGWWLENAGSCDQFCTLSPPPRECTENDCEWDWAEEFRDGGIHSRTWIVHSSTARTFTLIATYPDDGWSLPMACTLAVGDDSVGSSFTCVGNDEMDFDATTYTRPSAELEAALVTARTQGQGEYNY